jgi:hypothetical protein
MATAARQTLTMAASSHGRFPAGGLDGVARAQLVLRDAHLEVGDASVVDRG